MIKFNKVTSLPETPDADAIYFLKDGASCLVYTVDDTSQYVPLIDSGVERNISVVTSTSGVLTLDLSSNSAFYIQLSENISSINLTNCPSVFKKVTLIVEQGNTLAYSVNLSSFDNIGDHASISNSLDSSSIIELVTDDSGTSWMYDINKSSYYADIVSSQDILANRSSDTYFANGMTNTPNNGDGYFTQVMKDTNNGMIRFTASTGVEYTIHKISGLWDTEWVEQFSDANSINAKTFGIGIGVSDNAPDIGNYDTISFSGLYGSAGGEVGAPMSSSIATSLVMKDSGNRANVVTIHADETTDDVRIFVRGGLVSGDKTSWVEVLHSSNTGTSVNYDMTTSTNELNTNNSTKVGDYGFGAMRSFTDWQALPSGFCGIARMTSSATNRPAEIGTGSFYIFGTGAENAGLSTVAITAFNTDGAIYKLHGFHDGSVWTFKGSESSAYSMSSLGDGLNDTPIKSIIQQYDFGIGRDEMRLVDSTISDLNTENLATGLYPVSSSTLHTPSGRAGIVEILWSYDRGGVDGVAQMQRFIETGSAVDHTDSLNIYHRWHNGLSTDDWTPWVKMYDSGNSRSTITHTQIATSVTLSKTTSYEHHHINTSSGDRTITLSNSTFVDGDVVHLEKHLQANSLTVNGDEFTLPDGTTDTSIIVSSGTHAKVTLSRYSSGWFVTIY